MPACRWAVALLLVTVGAWAQAGENGPPPLAVPSGLPVLAADAQARMDRDLLEVTVPRLQALYAARRYTVEQVVRWELGRIGRYDALYKPVQTVDVEGALRVARTEDVSAKGSMRGALWGVPVVVKANTAVSGLPETDGWRGFALPGHAFVAGRDATVVARLRAEGAVIVGITNMPDFAASDTNRSTVFGRTGNAYDVRFSPGGSSGGTVTALTMNLAVVGTGTDTANSIRMPAGTSAVVGVLPTKGLVSIAGIAPLDWLLDNTGPIARTVTDAAIALGVMAGGDGVHPAVPGDVLDFRTSGAGLTPGFERAQLGPYLAYLKVDALRGKRFGGAGIHPERECWVWGEPAGFAETGNAAGDAGDVSAGAGPDAGGRCGDRDGRCAVAGGIYATGAQGDDAAVPAGWDEPVAWGVWAGGVPECGGLRGGGGVSAAGDADRGADAAAAGRGGGESGGVGVATAGVGNRSGSGDAVVCAATGGSGGIFAGNGTVQAGRVRVSECANAAAG